MSHPVKLADEAGWRLVCYPLLDPSALDSLPSSFGVNGVLFLEVERVFLAETSLYMRECPFPDSHKLSNSLVAAGWRGGLPLKCRNLPYMRAG